MVCADVGGGGVSPRPRSSSCSYRGPCRKAPPFTRILQDPPAGTSCSRCSCPIRPHRAAAPSIVGRFACRSTGDSAARRLELPNSAAFNCSSGGFLVEPCNLKLFRCLRLRSRRPASCLIGFTIRDRDPRLVFWLWTLYSLLVLSSLQLPTVIAVILVPVLDAVNSMGSCRVSSFSVFYALLGLCTLPQCFGSGLEANKTAILAVDASPQSGRKISDTLFGISFEEINHAGAGGLWAELVSNRGFEAGGPNTPSNIDPWSIVGNESSIVVSTGRSSCFELNKVALKMEVVCDNKGPNTCPPNGVGIYNPGFWGMNIEKGKTYKVILHVKSSGSVNISVSLTSADGLQNLASSTIIAAVSDVSDWKKVELLLLSKGTNRNSRIQLTSTQKGVIWFDQISVMPLDTYKGHGFREDLFAMLADLKPQFLRFPGGSYVEGAWLINAFHWKESIGPWEDRPGHFNDVWMYWTDDGLGYFEFLQLAEDLNANPVWVFNSGISHNDEVDTSNISPFVKDLLESIEFARGAASSTWGSVRAAMGHPEPFDLKYIALGNQDCGKKNYLGNYRKFYSALKAAYPDIKVITNCDGSSGQLDHAADLYDFHVYTSANNMFSMAHQFDHTSRSGPKAFVSEYAVTGRDAGRGNLLAALAQAAFLIGLEINSDVVEMASNAPLFVNANDWRYNPDAIVFNSWQHYGTPCYWMQQFFKESSGAIIFPTKVQSNYSTSLIASAVKWKSSDGNTYLKIKIVNFLNEAVNLNISVTGLGNSINPVGSTKMLLASNNPTDENSFNEPNKVVPQQMTFPNAGTEMEVVAPGYSISSYDLSLVPLVSSL